MNGGSIFTEYREQAERIRAAAETTTLPDIRAEMLRMAATYERLADRLEKLLSESGGGPPGVPKSA